MTSHRSWAIRPVSVGLALLALAAASKAMPSSRAMPSGMTLTGNGPNVFTLTTFASGFSNTANVGPIGIAYTTLGEVLVTDHDFAGAGSKLYRFPSHADNQVAAPGLVVANYPFTDATGLAQIQLGSDYQYYMGQTAANRIVEIDRNGVILQTIVSMNDPFGLAPYPPPPLGAVIGLTGHLFATDGLGNIWDVNPQTNSKTLFKATGAAVDGIAFSPDGATVYVALPLANVIRAYDTVTKVLTWTSPFSPTPVGFELPDGIAIGLGTLTGYIYVNCCDGDVWEFGVPGGPHAGVVNQIATGGTRGDFIAVDPNVWSGGSYPSLLLTQTDDILRLDPPGGGWFGPPTSSTAPVIELGTSFCFGDGSLPTACPCALPNTVPNPPAAPGHGCANSQNLDGALLSATGATAPDTVRFGVFVSPVYVGFGLMLKGNADAAGGVASADGIRCADGQLIRFGAHFAGTNGAPQGYWTYPNTAQTNPVSVQTAQPPGQTAHYQLYYRNVFGNPDTFCTPATTNWSNGIQFVWP